MATGVSADGKVIVGYGTNASGGTEAFIADLRTAEVPAPATLAMPVPGLALLIGLRHAASG